LELDGNFDLSQLPCRSRISQFIIIPPFQRKGLGDKLYNTLHQQYLNHPPTLELTVEDPNEAFDDLRDIADLKFLRSQPDFLALHIDTDIKIQKGQDAPSNIVDQSAAETVRKRYKIAPRQFARVLEMHLMSRLAESVRPGFELKSDVGVAPKDKHEHRLWHLIVKQRIYRQNKDTLGQLEIRDRITKLDETASSVEFDYARLLSMADARDHPRVAGASTSNGKRKLEDGQTSSSKKARVEEA
jgi:histone acetyltransferase 1